MLSRIICLFLLLQLTGCDTPSENIEKIDVYAIDQQYACGDNTIYTIIRVENPTDNSPKLKDRAASLDINTKDKDIEREIEAALFASSEELPENEMQTVKKNSVVGKEFTLIFPNKRQEALFDWEFPSFTRCYIYRFNGYFKNGNLGDCSNGNHFVVSEYSLIPKYPDCVKQYEDDLNKVLEEEKSRDQRHEN